MVACWIIISLVLGQAALAVEPWPPAERLVGIAYSTWFPPIPWTNVWGTPELGHYRSDDIKVIRQHAEWLQDAGVDFLWIDWSNNVEHNPTLQNKESLIKDGKIFLAFRPYIHEIESATKKVFKVLSKMPKSPNISIFLGCPHKKEAITDGRLQRKANQVYKQFVIHPKYGRLVQRYLGKPLLVIYVGTPSPFQESVPTWSDERFTVRWMTGFVTEQRSLRNDELVSRYGYWSWEDRGKQTYTIHNGRAESMVVVAACRQQSEPGSGRYIAPIPRREGLTFREQWKRAREIGPKFAMVVSWNEWTLKEQPSLEISKDIEPSLEFGRTYLNLLKEEIAKFKGVRPMSKSSDE
ncbi:MAG: glycoside hydrolase family 71/99 protein [Planctomycetota bacterium]|jgi:hypothetical protein